MDETEFKKYIQEYIRHCCYEKNLDPKTLRAYSTDLLQFSDYIYKTGLNTYKEAVQTYVVVLHNSFAPKSVSRKIASLKAFFAYLEYEKIIESNPFDKMRIKIRSSHILPRTIPLATIASLLQCTYNQRAILPQNTYQSRANLRDIAVLELLFATGIRISELCYLQKCDLDLHEGTIKILGKGAKERIIQIGNPDVLNALNSYYNAFNTTIECTGWFFVNRLGNRLSDQSVRNMISSYCRLAGIAQHITPHMFRHSFATYLLEEDVDIRYIQMLLGHSSIVTTQIYTHVSSKKQRDILESKHPRNRILTP